MIKAIIVNGQVANIIEHTTGALTMPEGQMYVPINGQPVAIGMSYDYVTGVFSDAPGIPRRVSALEITTSDAQLVSSITFVALAETGQIDDVTIAEHADVFVVWDSDFRGKAGTIVRDDGGLYRSLHDIKDAGQNVKPSTNPTMWKAVADPAEEWPEWSQPLGSHDAYDKGAKVTKGGKRWVSDIDGNVWAPGVHGWTAAD